MTQLSAARARDLLAYEPDYGLMFWRVRVNSKVPSGALAGSIKEDCGYRMIRVDGRCYRASRLAWLIVTGEWPAQFIDHHNGDRADDRWINLREATRRENQRNRPGNLGSNSGLKGVSRKRDGWRARIFYDGRERSLGTFASPDAAAQAYDAAAREHFGEFAFVNFPREGEHGAGGRLE